MARHTSTAAPGTRPHKQGAGAAAPASAGNSRELFKKAPRRSTSRAPTETDIQVGAHLRRIRLARNMTLAELGADLGISHQQLQKYETGTNRLSAGMLKHAADTLSVCILDFFDDAATTADIEAEAASQTAEIFTQIAELSRMGARQLRQPIAPKGLIAGRNLQNPPIHANAIPEGVRV